VDLAVGHFAIHPAKARGASRDRDRFANQENFKQMWSRRRAIDHTKSRLSVYHRESIALSL